jgi:hypothetical protein
MLRQTHSMHASLLLLVYLPLFFFFTAALFIFAQSCRQTPLNIILAICPGQSVITSLFGESLQVTEACIILLQLHMAS